MSLEVGLPSNPVAANGGGAFGRKAGRAASDESDFTGALGGFSAVLAGVDDSPSAPEDSESERGRRRKSNEANATPIPPASQENSEPSVKGVVAKMAPAAELAKDHVSPAQDVMLSTGLAESGLRVVGAVAFGATPSDAMSRQGLDVSLLKDRLNLGSADVPKTGPVADASSELFYAEFALSSLNGVQDPALTAGLDASKTFNPSATFAAGNVSLAASKLSSVLAGVKAKLANDKVGGDAPQENEGVIVSGGVVSPEEGSFRARISQEIKRLTQQASLSRESIDPHQHVAFELEPPKYGKAASELNLATLEARGEAGVEGAEFSTSANDTSPSPPLDGFLATATDLDNGGTYLVSGDLKNAKMKLVDAAEGVVEVSISLQGNQAQVAFKADETMTRNALQDSSSELKEMLRRDGIELSGVSVGTSGAGDGGGDRESSRSESRPPKPMQTVAPSLERPAFTGPTSNAQRLDLYV